MSNLENKVRRGFVTLAAAVMLSPIADTIISFNVQNSGGLYAQQKSSFFREYSKKSNKGVDTKKVNSQKAVLQPVDFDIVLNGYVYDSYRDVSFRQVKDGGFSLKIPEGGVIRIIDPQKAGKYVEDIIMYTETGDKLFDNRGKSAFSDEVDTKKLGLKSGNQGHLTFNLEFGLDIPSSMEVPYEIVPAPQPEPRPEPQPQPRQPARPAPREYEPPVELPQSEPPVIVYFQGQPPVYPVARPAGIFELFFGFSSVRHYPVGGYAPYPIGGCAPYPVMAPPMMGVGCTPYGPPINYCPPPNHYPRNAPHRPNIQRNNIINRSSLLAPRASQARPVTRSSLQQRNVRSAPARSAQIRRR